jgi:hypothetical protein
MFISTKDLCPNFITKATKLQSSSRSQSSDATASTQRQQKPIWGSKHTGLHLQTKKPKDNPQNTANSSCPNNLTSCSDAARHTKQAKMSLQERPQVIKEYFSFFQSSRDDHLTAAATSQHVALHVLHPVNDVKAPHSSRLQLLPSICLCLPPFIDLPNS